jgi:hypothetical protein
MYATIGDLITALQKFPKTAKVLADNKSIQNVYLTSSTSGIVEISTTAPAKTP